MRNSKLPERRARRFLALVCLPWLAASSLNCPAQAGIFTISPQKERKIGQQAAEEIEKGAPIVTGPVADWVQRIGARLAKVSDPEFHYSFVVIDGPEINAFTLPSGYIYVYTGLRKVVKTDDELAAVLGHEITHAEHHHYAKQYAKDSARSAILGIGSLALGLPDLAGQALNVYDYSLDQQYSRDHEYEADHEGMLRMARAGFDPAAMVTVLTRLSQEDKGQDSLDHWFSDHPDGKKRVAAARQLLAQIRPAEAAALDSSLAAPTPVVPAPAPAVAGAGNALAPK